MPLPSSISIATTAVTSVRKSHNSLQPRRHPRFYFPDGNVVFLVENWLYNVHPYFFRRDSPIFDAMFSLPCPAGYIPEGQVDENPIWLECTESKDFDRLLSVLYPQDFVTCELKTSEEWFSVLHLATRWELASLRELAIIRLQPIASPAEKIAWGHRFDLHDWLKPAYTELCMRHNSLTLEEGQTIGIRNVINIMNVRESIRYRSNFNRPSDTIQKLIQEACVESHTQ